jgi:microcin C transport system ATP-binding protein
MIAMALANEPDLSIADEPTTALDVTVQAQILELLRLKAIPGCDAVHHARPRIVRGADRVCVMTKGEIVETGPTGGLLRPSTPTRALLAAEPRASARRRRMRPSSCG